LCTVVGAMVGLLGVVVVVVVVPPPPPPPPVVVVVVGVVVVVVELVVVVVVGVVVVVVVVVGVVVVVVGVVVVVVVVVPPSQCEMVKTGVGAVPAPFQSHVANAVVLPAGVPGPGTSALKLFPWGLIENVLPFTCSTTLLTSPALLPKPVRIHRDVPPEQGRNPAPLTPFQVVCCVLASAAPGKTAINPAVVSRLLRLTRSCCRSILCTSPIAVIDWNNRGTWRPRHRRF
jgi:hypothetical protein